MYESAMIDMTIDYDERRICLPRFNRASNKTNTSDDRSAPFDTFENMPFEDDLGDRDKAELGELLGGGLPSGNSSGFDKDMPLFDESLPTSEQPSPAAREKDVDLRKSFGVLFKAISDRIKGKKKQPSPEIPMSTDVFDDGLTDFMTDDFSDNTPNGNGYGGYPDNAPNGNGYGGYPDNAPNGNSYGGYPDNTPNGNGYGGYPDNTPNGNGYGEYPDNAPNRNSYGGYPDNTPNGNGYGADFEQPAAWDNSLSEMPAFGDSFDDSSTEPVLPSDDSHAKPLSVGAHLSTLFVKAKDKLSHIFKRQSVPDDGLSFDDHGEFSDFIEWEEQGQETGRQDGEAIQSSNPPFPFADNRNREGAPSLGEEYGTAGNGTPPYPYTEAPKEAEEIVAPEVPPEKNSYPSRMETDRSVPKMTPIGQLLAAMGHSWRKFRRRLPSFKPKVYTVPVPDYQPEEDGIQAPSLVSDIEKIIRKQSQLGEVEREYEEMRSYIRSVDVNAAPRREEIPPPENIHEVREAENELFDMIRQIDVQNEQQRSRIGIYDAPPEEDPYNYRGINDNRQSYDDIEDASFDMRPRLSFESEQRIDPTHQWNERPAFRSPYDNRGDFDVGMPAMWDGRFAPRQRVAQENFAPDNPAGSEGRTSRFAPRQQVAQENFAPDNPAGSEGRTSRFAPRQRVVQENFAPENPAGLEGRTSRFAPRQRVAQENFAPDNPAGSDGRSGRFAPRQKGKQNLFTAESNPSPAPGSSASVKGNAGKEKRKAKVRKRRNMADW